MDLDDEELELTRKMNGSKGSKSDEYIRTRDGRIGKVITKYKFENMKYCVCNSEPAFVVSENEIIKRGNIINDLLEIGEIIEVDGNLLVYNDSMIFYRNIKNINVINYRERR